ncbi:Nucleoporin nup45 [Daldinia childiae]|uniref:Nucleoporin nup45 n=1 Tax=Daldinia childiae TaxID=326645 RepID=UPI0014474F6B|nr:Nucleoporin nup45 [Daldinia childiae]KAF3066485.1 Nucleoporin nup45 [Daldinia childiae]
MPPDWVIKLTHGAEQSGSSSTQPPAPGGSLFGNTSTTPKPSLFGNPTTSSSTTTTQPQSGGLFSSSSATPSQPSQGGPSLFGTANTTTTQPQQGGGLFGSSQTTQAQPQQGGGLFGSLQSAQTQPQTQTQTQPAIGLFGGSTTAQATSTGTGASGTLFGSSLKPPQPAASNVGALFSQAVPAQQKPSPFGSTLSQPTQSQPQQPGLGLGSSLGLGLTMGQSSTQQTVPGVRIDVSNLKGTTRFNDLQEDLQKKIETVDMLIQRQMQYKDEVDSFMPGHKEMLESIPNDVSFVAKKYESAHSALASAAQAIEASRGLVAQDVDHARLSFRAIDNLKLPEQYHTAGIWSPRQQSAGTANTEADGQDLVSFFSKAADDMEDQVKRYDQNMTEIEMHMHGVSDNMVEQLQKMMANKTGASSGPNEKAQELSAVLRELQQGILKVASDVASAREDMTQLQLGNFISNDGDRNGVY